MRWVRDDSIHRSKVRVSMTVHGSFSSPWWGIYALWFVGCGAQKRKNRLYVLPSVKFLLIAYYRSSLCVEGATDPFDDPTELFGLFSMNPRLGS